MAGFRNDVVYANNADFSTAGAVTGSAANGLNTDGQLWIGTTSANPGGTHVSVGTLTSPDMSVTIGYDFPNITLQSSGGGGTYYSLTPYIVGQTGDTHAQFTGDTGIQAAIDQALFDGHSSINPANIYIKPGAYSPTGGVLVMHDGINLYGMSNQVQDQTGVSVTAQIEADSAFTSASVSGIKFIQTGTGGYFLDLGATSSTVIFYINNCFIEDYTANFVLSNGGGAKNIIFNNSYCGNNALYDNSSTDNLNISFNYSSFSSSANATRSSGNTVIGGYGSSIAQSFYQTGTSGFQLNCQYCNIQGAIDSSGSSSSASVVASYNNNFGGLVNFDPTTLGFNNSTINGATFNEKKWITSYSTDVTLTFLDTVVFMGVIAPATVTLPSSVGQGYQITIKDIVGNVSTNNITITPQMGGSVDGQSTYILGTDWGSVTLITNDGFNWYVL